MMYKIHNSLKHSLREIHITMFIVTSDIIIIIIVITNFIYNNNIVI